MLKEKQILTVIAHSDTTELVDTVKAEVGGRLHLERFPERKHFWEICAGDAIVDKIVAAL